MDFSRFTKSYTSVLTALASLEAAKNRLRPACRLIQVSVAYVNAAENAAEQKAKVKALAEKVYTTEGINDLEKRSFQ